MSFRRLLVLPFVVALAPAIVMLGIEPGRTRDVSLQVVIEIAKIFALTGSLIAASAFDRGDHLRRAWLFHAACYVFLLFRDLLYGLWLPRYTGEPLSYFEAVLVVLANASGVLGVWMLSRTWQIAGLVLPWSAAARRILRTLGIVLGLAIAGPSILLELDNAVGGEIQPMVRVVSGVADVIGLTLIVPVMLTALALRGGLLIWPWGLLTASQLSWLLYDFTVLLRHLAVIEPSMATMWREIFRALACAFCLSAGIAQRAVSMPVPRASYPGPAA